MIENFFWDYFTMSGNVDAYLAYREFENGQKTTNYQESKADTL